MDAPAIKRRLAAILAADAVGYSKHMARDEEGTLRVLSGHRVIIDGLIATFSGRIVGTAGDSVLAEFGSSVDAVRCAVEIQAALATRNDSLPEPDHLLFRIGINLGDVIVEGDDILGDGVNVAARLESIAEPGGICVSSSIYDQITGKLNLGFADMGHQSLKNIGRPVRTYMVSRDGAAPVSPAFEVPPATPSATHGTPAAKSSATPWLAAAGAVGLVIVAAMLMGGRLAPAGAPSPAAAIAAPADVPASASVSSVPAESPAPAAGSSAPTPVSAEVQSRPAQPAPAAAPVPVSGGPPAPTPTATTAAASVAPEPASSATVTAAAAPPVSAVPKTFTGGTATGACEGDDQLTGAGTVRVEGVDVFVSFPPAAGRRAPVVARGRLSGDGGVTLQVVRGGRGRGGAGGSFSGRLVDGRGTLNGPSGRCTILLQLN